MSPTGVLAALARALYSHDNEIEDSIAMWAHPPGSSDETGIGAGRGKPSVRMS